MVDALDSKSSGPCGRGGSSPPSPTVRCMIHVTPVLSTRSPSGWESLSEDQGPTGTIGFDVARKVNLIMQAVSSPPHQLGKRQLRTITHPLWPSRPELSVGQDRPGSPLTGINPLGLD